MTLFRKEKKSINNEINKEEEIQFDDISELTKPDNSNIKLKKKFNKNILIICGGFLGIFILFFIINSSGFRLSTLLSKNKTLNTVLTQHNNIEFPPQTTISVNLSESKEKIEQSDDETKYQYYVLAIPEYFPNSNELAAEEMAQYVFFDRQYDWGIHLCEIDETVNIIGYKKYHYYLVDTSINSVVCTLYASDKESFVWLNDKNEIYELAVLDVNESNTHIWVTKRDKIMRNNK